MQKTKVCSRCKKVKSITEYNKNVARKSGLSYYCKKCDYIANNKWRIQNLRYSNELLRNWRTQNRERVNASARALYKRDKIRINKLRSKMRKHWSCLPTGKFAMYRSSAKVRHLGFTISFKQFMKFWQQPCFYCGNIPTTIGLDRIDNDKGYTMDNIVPCCGDCNFAKKNRDVMTYVTHCALVIHHFKMSHPTSP